MAEIIDLYNVDREHTGKTAKRGEPLEEGTYRMVIHVCILMNYICRQKKWLTQNGQATKKSRL